MNFKQLAIGTLAGGVTFFFLGYLAYGILLPDFMAANAGSATGVAKEPVDFAFLILGNLALAGLITFIFTRWAGITTFMTGLKAGVIIGLLMGMSSNFVSYATANIMNLTAGVVDIIVYAILVGIMSGVIGLVLGKTKA